MPAGPQRAIVARAAEEWAQGLGRRPGFFRPGTFSANDATAGIAAELGFAGVSMSVPGRSFPDLGAIWVGCPPDPHRMHPAMRLLEGAMALPNMPLSVDFSQTRRRGNRSWHPDLRPDQAYDDLPGSVARVVDQILSRAPAVPVLNIVTHNDNDYTDPADPARRNLEAILAAIRAAAGERGAACRGAAIEDVCARVAALPPPEPAFVRT
jgi:hypothetical protein